MTKTGNVYLRRGLLIATQSMVNHNDENAEYYQWKFKETPRHAHKIALSLTACKLVRLVYDMLSTNQLYMTPKERKQRNKEEDNSTNTSASVENVTENETLSVETVSSLNNVDSTQQTTLKKEHKKVKGTAAATSSSRQRVGTQRIQHPLEHAVSS